MAFYVPLGPRGILFRIGTVLIGWLGSTVYRQAHSRRRRDAQSASTSPMPMTTAR